MAQLDSWEIGAGYGADVAASICETTLTADYTDGHTSWHNVFSFNENQHSQLKRLGKG